MTTPEQNLIIGMFRNQCFNDGQGHNFIAQTPAQFNKEGTPLTHYSFGLPAQGTGNTPCYTGLFRHGVFVGIYMHKAIVP